MGSAERVFKIRASVEERRPKIDFRSSSVAWDQFEEIIKGERNPREGETLRLVSGAKRASEWDCFDSGGLGPLLSQRSIKAIGRAAFDTFTFINATINGAPYCLLRPDARVECLDRPRSKLVMFEHDPSSVMNIRQYAFHFEKLRDPMVFCIPEEDRSIFATQTVEQIIASADFRGFRFIFLAGEPAGVARDAAPEIRIYHNEFFGIRIDIPEPWDLLSWKHAKIARSWRQHYQTRDDELPNEEKVGKFLFTATRHSLQGRGTIDGSIELCVFRFPSGTTFANMERDGAPPDRQGVWNVGGAQLPYYDHDLQRPDGGTIRHAYRQVTETLWLYAKIAGYSRQLFQEAVKLFEGLSWSCAITHG